MAKITRRAAEQALDQVIALHRGPGGAATILQNGEVLVQKTWGYADLDKRIPMKSDTRLPICSISKQFLCLLIADLARERSDFHQQLSDELVKTLPKALTQGTSLTVQHLCNMQSGIRDYFAMATLWGTQPEGPFAVAKEATESLQRLKSFHFEPGTMFSYCNTNFHTLGRLVERVTGKAFGDLLAERIFPLCKMKTAELVADNAKLPPPCIGYEGSEQGGYYPALNRMEWSGDAGIVASLDDMIAYEQYFDQCWSNQKGLPHIIGEPQKFKDDTPAMYGNGLSYADIGGYATVGHGGSLRGYQLHRRYIPSERVSIFIMFNYQNEITKAAYSLIEKLLGVESTSSFEPVSNWYGSFFDPEARLVYEVKKGGKGKVVVGGDQMTLTDTNHARSYTTTASIEGDVLALRFMADNRNARAERIVKTVKNTDGETFTGDYHCAEAESTFHCTGTGDMLYGSFDGYLGKGPEYLIRSIGGNIWMLANPRGLDTPAPGNWTLVFERNADDTITAVTIGCWLARNLRFTKLDSTKT